MRAQAIGLVDDEGDVNTDGGGESPQFVAQEADDEENLDGAVNQQINTPK